MKPHLAVDIDYDRLVFPVGAQPKIDGVRALTTEGGLTGRSLKKFKNKYTTAFHNKPEYMWLDGEMAVGHECDQDLCRNTASALSTITGEPQTTWHVFDYLHKTVIDAVYQDRYMVLQGYVASLHAQGKGLNLKVVPMTTCLNMHHFLELKAWFLEQGYEGIIARTLRTKHKQGRSTVLQGGILRGKDFIDGEILVTGITEGETNNNEAQINELGRTFRTSHQENKVANGMLGTIQGILLADLVDPSNGRVLVLKGEEINVSAGEMDHGMRKHYIDHPEDIVDHIVTFKFFPKGIKDKPRFATFKSIRDASDISS